VASIAKIAIKSSQPSGSVGSVSVMFTIANSVVSILRSREAFFKRSLKDQMSRKLKSGMKLIKYH
jgi:hypothetical protein